MPVPQDYVPIPGTERTPMRGARMVAAADPNERMQVTVMVRPKQSLAAATARVNSDTPPSERRHMTHEEYRAEFGADPTDLTKVQDFAKAHNLQVSEVNDEQRSVKLTGTAADFSKAFGVELNRYEHPGGSYRGRTGSILIPQSLDGVVQGVFGLDDRPAADPHCGMRKAEVAMGAGIGTGARDLAPLAGGTFTSPQLAQFYNFPANKDGTGQAIGI